MTFVFGLPGGGQALLAWARLLAAGSLPAVSVRFAAWMRMALTTHTSRCAAWDEGLKALYNTGGVKHESNKRQRKE